MRTDAKNLVTTARTMYLAEQKETIHMMSMLRKEACSGNINDLVQISTQNCLADSLTKASAKAENLITAVKTWRLWKLTVIQMSGHPWSTRPSCLPGVEHFCTREKDVFFLNALRFPLTPTQREGPFHVMFVRNQHTDEQQELNMCEFESQDATKITSASADSRINFSRTMRSLLVRTSCLCLVLMILSQCFTFFSQHCDHVIIKISWCWQGEQMDTEFCSAP